MIAVVSCGLSAVCQAQSAEQILKRNLRAVGGTKVLAGIKSFTVKGQLYRPRDGKTGFYTEIARAPNELFEEIEVGQEVHREGYNGKSAWRQDRSGALATLTGDEAVLTEAIAKSRNARSLNYGKGHSRGRLAGQESIRGRQVF